MNRDSYARISLNNFDNKSENQGIRNFVVSENRTDLQDYPFDFRYPQIMDGIAFAICVKGSGKIRINLREYQIEPSTIIVVLPNYILELVEQSEDLVVEFLLFSFDFISDIKLITDIDIPRKIDQMACLKISEEETFDLLELHAFIVKRYKKTDFLYREEIAKNLLQTLIYEVLQLYQDKRIEYKMLTRKEKYLQSFVSLLFENHMKERSVSFYADKMFITPKYLSQIIKEASGIHIQEWIDDMVIMAIKALLKSSNMTILQISEEMNFANPSFFGSYFKKRTRMTPLQYRKNNSLTEAPHQDT